MHVFETDITSHHLIPRMHTCRNVGDTCTGLNFGLFSPSVSFSLHVARGSSRWHCAAVCGNVAVNTGAVLLSLWLLDPLLCSEGHLNASFHSPAIPPCFFFFWVIFVFHSQLCSDKMALRSVSRSITDKAWLRGNFQPDQLGLSIVCPEYFGNK